MECQQSLLAVSVSSLQSSFLFRQSAFLLDLFFCFEVTAYYVLFTHCEHFRVIVNTELRRLLFFCTTTIGIVMKCACLGLTGQSRIYDKFVWIDLNPNSCDICEEVGYL